MRLFKGSQTATHAAAAELAVADSSVPCTALAQFFRRVVQVHSSPCILLVGEVCGSNVSFLGERGFRVRMEPDVSPRPGGGFAGALLWDTLGLMPPGEAQQRTSLLREALAEGGPVLALFGPMSGRAACPRTRYRILSESLVAPEAVPGRTAVAHPYQNGDIVRLFEGFDVELIQMRRDGRRDALFYKSRSTHSA